MNIGSSARVPVLTAPPGAAYLSATSSRSSSRTELPAQAAVAPTPELPENRPDGARSSRSDVSRNVTIDPGTREVVLQAISRQSGEVVRQVPDQALLRIKAYAREMRHAPTEAFARAPVKRSA